MCVFIEGEANNNITTHWVPKFKTITGNSRTIHKMVNCMLKSRMANENELHNMAVNR